MTEALDAAETDPLLTVAEINLEHAAKRLSATTGRPRKCECTDYTVATLCETYAAQPTPLLKGLILRSTVRTRADALAVLTLLEKSDDQDISAHLLRMVRVHLAAA
jgi:hypothetical protein